MVIECSIDNAKLISILISIFCNINNNKSISAIMFVNPVAHY